jgi:hypothetical protein
MRRFIKGDRIFHRLDEEPATVIGPGPIKTTVRWDDRDEKNEGVVDTRDLDFTDPANPQADMR